MTKKITQLALLAGALTLPATVHAISFHVDLNVAGLSASTDTPYALDLQLNKGGVGTLNNSAFISGLTFIGVAPVPGSELTFGGAAGNFLTGISLTESDAQPFSEYDVNLTQPLPVGPADISFNVNLSDNNPALTPDGFLASILGASNFISTTSPDGLSLVTASIDGQTTADDVHAYVSTDPGGVFATVSNVPETADAALLLLPVCGLLVGFSRRTAAQV